MKAGISGYAAPRVRASFVFDYDNVKEGHPLHGKERWDFTLTLPAGKITVEAAVARSEVPAKVEHLASVLADLSEAVDEIVVSSGRSGNSRDYIKVDW